jgi:hypothetical protein
MCFFFEKTSPPHLAVSHKKYIASSRILLFTNFLSAFLGGVFFNLLKISTVVVQVDKICFSNFVDLLRLADLPRLKLQPSVASTRIFLQTSGGAPCSLLIMVIPERIFRNLN